MGVNVVKLEDVCEFYRGLTYSKKDEATFSGNIVLRASNIDLDTSTLILDDLKYLKEDFVIPNDKKLQKDCIFICMSSGSKSHLGKVAYIDRDYNYAFGGFMGLIKPKTNILPRYLFYLLQTPEYKELIKKLSNGININNIKFSDLKEFQFELPSLEEQEKILNILDKADEIRAKKKLANDKLDEFLKSTFITMFGNISNKTTLSQYITTLSAGKSLAGEEECENKVLNTSSVTWDRFDKNQYKNYPLDYIPQEEHKVRIGDVIISRMNTPALVGTVGYVWDVDDNIYLPDRLWKANITDKVNPIFLWQLLIQPSTKIEIQKIATGTSGSMKNISKEKFLKLSVLNVAIEEQNKFAKIVEKVEAQKQKNELVIEQMNNLFNSLSQRAFKGEL